MAWVITATALVWIMIPGVGYFYSGLLRRKNALSMIWLSMVCLAVVSFQVSRQALFRRTVRWSHIPPAVVLLGVCVLTTQVVPTSLNILFPGFRSRLVTPPTGTLGTFVSFPPYLFV